MREICEAKALVLSFLRTESRRFSISSIMRRDVSFFDKTLMGVRIGPGGGAGPHVTEKKEREGERSTERIRGWTGKVL